jgi:hypothetical protein
MVGVEKITKKNAPNRFLVKNLNTSKFQPIRRYEIKKLPNFFQQLQSCVTANYTIIETSKIKVVNFGAIK